MKTITVYALRFKENGKYATADGRYSMDLRKAVLFFLKDAKDICEDFEEIVPVYLKAGKPLKRKIKNV